MTKRFWAPRQYPHWLWMSALPNNKSIRSLADRLNKASLRPIVFHFWYQPCNGPDDQPSHDLGQSINCSSMTAAGGRISTQAIQLTCSFRRRYAQVLFSTSTYLAPTTAKQLAMMNRPPSNNGLMLGYPLAVTTFQSVLSMPDFDAIQDAHYTPRVALLHVGSLCLLK